MTSRDCAVRLEGGEYNPGYPGGVWLVQLAMKWAPENTKEQLVGKCELDAIMFDLRRY